MSKIGEKHIQIEQGTQIEIQKEQVTVKGPKGELTFTLPGGLTVSMENNELIVTRKKDEKRLKALHGLYRSLIANAVEGVQKPWEKRLELAGTGYSVKLQGEDLALKVGYSHQVIFAKVPGIILQVEGNNKIVISGIDKQLVGQVAHQIKIIKKPDAYKGKGIKYEGERLRIKPGKKAKAAGA